MALIKRSMLPARPQELGKIKIGGKGEERQKKNKPGETYQLPVKYDHFVVTTRTRGPDGNFAIDDRIHAHPKVGQNPTELDAILMYPEIEQNLHTELVQYQGRTKVVACDGEAMTDLKSGEVKECPRAAGGACACKPYARLHLHLLASPFSMGYHVFRTTSWETTNNIQTALEEIHENFGSLYHAPVRLVLYPAEDHYMEGNIEKTSNSWKVGLVLAMGLEEAAERMVQAKRTIAVTRKTLMLSATEVMEELDERDKEEADDIHKEWFPDEPPTDAQSLDDALKAQDEDAAPVVEADVEEDTGQAATEAMPESNPVPEDSPAEAASPGMITQVTNLMAKAREAGVLTAEMEASAELAVSRGEAVLVNRMLSELSMALIKKRAEAETDAQGSLLKDG